jgi:hypothetical protein
VRGYNDYNKNDPITIFFGDTLTTRQFPARNIILMATADADKFVMEIEFGGKQYYLDATVADHPFNGFVHVLSFKTF